MAISSTSFKPDHKLSKGNQGAKRRVAYDALWNEAIKTDGSLFLQKLRDHRDCEDKNVSVRACDIFFKYARPPENTPLPETSRTEAAQHLIEKYGFSSDDWKEIQARERAAREEKIQELLAKKNASGSDMVENSEEQNGTS